MIFIQRKEILEKQMSCHVENEIAGGIQKRLNLKD